MALDYRIWFVDDEAPIRTLYSLYIKQYQTKTSRTLVIRDFENGKQAWTALQNTRPEHLPHLLLTDNGMPEMTGLELLTFLKEARDKYSTIQCVMVTAEAHNAELAQKLGARAFIKPYKMQDILALVHDADIASR